jgi:glycosyltransferase involved in cell wall biosynthesis
MGGYCCSVLNKFLKEPLTCLNCLGYLGIKTGGDNLKRCVEFAQKADLIVVHSEFMKEFYHTYNPVVLPLPLETDILIPYNDGDDNSDDDDNKCDDKCKNKEDYILYTGRLSFEKNPYGFLDVVNKSGLKGKMILYELSEDIIGTRNHYKELIELINNNKNIELILNPSIEKMIDLVRHAKFTVLPYFFAEPFGIAAVNSVLCGTPLITFPYGNLRSFTRLLPRTLDEMIQMVKVKTDDKWYMNELAETIKKGNELRIIHKPENAIKIWDEMYDTIL